MLGEGKRVTFEGIFGIIILYMGLISFDVGTFTSSVRKPEANVRFH